MVAWARALVREAPLEAERSGVGECRGEERNGSGGGETELTVHGDGGMTEAVPPTEPWSGWRLLTSTSVITLGVWGGMSTSWWDSAGGPGLGGREEDGLGVTEPVWSVLELVSHCSYCLYSVTVLRRRTHKARLTPANTATTRPPTPTPTPITTVELLLSVAPAGGGVGAGVGAATSVGVDVTVTAVAGTPADCSAEVMAGASANLSAATVASVSASSTRYCTAHRTLTASRRRR
mmetsp:Transcript_19368/g.46253  ORF Transcript_19368/g.46253 Transcript_19368/m.46253 type:complete len:235 (-) Transcript_19368:657-1361(-)